MPIFNSRSFSLKLVVKSSRWLVSYSKNLEVGRLGQTQSIALSLQREQFLTTHVQYISIITWTREADTLLLKELLNRFLVHYHFHKSVPLDSTLSQFNPSQSFKLYICKVKLMLFSHTRLDLPTVCHFKQRSVVLRQILTLSYFTHVMHNVVVLRTYIDTVVNRSKQHWCDLKQRFEP
jgi:hypothetical protein